MWMQRLICAKFDRRFHAYFGVGAGLDTVLIHCECAVWEQHSLPNCDVPKYKKMPKILKNDWYDESSSIFLLFERWIRNLWVNIFPATLS